MSLCTPLTGLAMNYNRHCRLEFGEYVHTHEEHDNSLNPHTIGALALHPTGNVQGDHGNDWQSPQKMKKNENQDFYGCQHFEMSIVIQHTYFGSHRVNI